MSLDAWHLTHDAWDIPLDTWPLTLNTWRWLFDTWYLTHDTRTHDTWHMTHDTWHMTHDTWHLAHDNWQKNTRKNTKTRLISIAPSCDVTNCWPEKKFTFLTSASALSGHQRAKMGQLGTTKISQIGLELFFFWLDLNFSWLDLFFPAGFFLA